MFLTPRQKGFAGSALHILLCDKGRTGDCQRLHMAFTAHTADVSSRRLASLADSEVYLPSLSRFPTWPLAVKFVSTDLRVAQDPFALATVGGAQLKQQHLVNKCAQ